MGPLIGKRETNESKTVKYRYEYFAESKENLILTPISKVFLFDPPKEVVTMSSNFPLFCDKKKIYPQTPWGSKRGGGAA